VKKILQDYTIDELKRQLEGYALQKFRYEQIYKWCYEYCDILEMSNLPLELREKLNQEFTSQPIKIEKEFVSVDGTRKFLLRLMDGNLIECVLMQYKYGNTICVSTQVGCRMGCSFCASGIDGLARNLSAGEILSEVLCVNKYLGGTIENRMITNIVLMGSGEPLDNYDNVVKFIRLVSQPKLINISQRNISLSTCGIAPKIKSLADEDLTITLTISLHSSNDEHRKGIMKIANAYSLDELMESVRYYFNKTNRRVVFEYIMLEDNTKYPDALRLKHLLSGISSHINLIPVNSTANGTKGIGKDRQTKFWEHLKKVGITATTRRTLGSDIDGACGQLKRRYEGDKDNV